MWYEHKIDKRIYSSMLEGQNTIPQRMKMLAKQKEFLLLKLSQLNEHLAYIDYKNKFYQDVLSGKIPYKSDLIKIDDNN